MMYVLLPAVFVAVCMAVFFWKRKKSADRRFLLETQLPPALYSVASISPSLPFETVLLQLRHAAASPLKEVFSDLLL